MPIWYYFHDASTEQNAKIPGSEVLLHLTIHISCLSIGIIFKTPA